MNRRQVIRTLSLGAAAFSARNLSLNAMERMPLPPSPPIPPEQPLAIGYLHKVRDMLTWIRETQSENLLEGAYALARTVKNGGTVWNCWDVGHALGADMFEGRNGEPAIFTTGYDPARSKTGDLLMVGLLQQSQEAYDDYVQKDLFVIGTPVPWGKDAKGQEMVSDMFPLYAHRPNADIWIESNITTLGAVMKLPGSPAPIGPVSGIIGMVTFWMMAADACRVLARDGMSVTVKGDEPALDINKTKWENLNDPLMDVYFDICLKQIGMIESEFGNVQKIAGMAVDTVLGGGKVYCYSRYQEGLAVEASTRRGGLTLTKGIWDGQERFRGTAKDLVIMGISKPDDEADLRNLDKFRQIGMKVVSIGPAVRESQVPGGRTVPKETDVHAGWMCDTYGLFAVPGLSQKICATSGPVMNQLFWAICLEIAEELISRTGNVPGVYLSGAIKGGIEHLQKVNSMYQARGY